MSEEFFRRYMESNRFLSDAEVRANRDKVLEQGGPVNMTDAELDDKWAALHRGSRAAKSYYDYYFAGSDIRVYVAELGDDPQFSDLPIMSIAYKVEQQKAPLYGFQSYTYSAVMRGTRLVEGVVQIAPKYPGYMKSLLAAAADARSRNTNLKDPYPAAFSLTEDERNINTYWQKNIDPAAAMQGGNEFSVHPPFSLVIVFGVQDTSVEVTDPQFNRYQYDTALYSDHNQRVVEGLDNTKPTRYILEACELTNMQTEYGSGGEVVSEMYSFFARDLITPPANYRVQSNHPPGGGVQEGL